MRRCITLCIVLAFFVAGTALSGEKFAFRCYWRAPKNMDAILPYDAGMIFALEDDRNGYYIDGSDLVKFSYEEVNEEYVARMLFCEAENGTYFRVIFSSEETVELYFPENLFLAVIKDQWKY